MINVVGVRFKRAGKIYYFDPGEIDVDAGQNVVVETVRGTELGEVAAVPRLVTDDEVVQPLKKILRVATDTDMAQVIENNDKEREAFTYAQEKIEALQLEMKLVEVEYTFDKNKLVFYFAADQRIDFRELVKELAARFHTRIELRQIGVRDEAKMLGGLGVCGQGLCCSTWIGDFAPVSIRHAKDQDLSMNPNKISGVCGRLKCCLRYESEAYEDARARQPGMGDIVLTPTGEARVVAVNLLRENCTLQSAEGPRFTVTWLEHANYPLKATGGCHRCSKHTIPHEAVEEVSAEADERSGKRTGVELESEGVSATVELPVGVAPVDGAVERPRPPRKPRKRPAADRPAREPVAKEPEVAQEIAAGSDEEQKAARKRRRWHKRKPRSKTDKEAMHVPSA